LSQVVKITKVKKISDKEFLTILRENAGLFARTAKAIEKQFKVEYSRQAVAQRAKQHPLELEDIEEENIDIAEEGLHSLMKSENESVKMKSIELYLKTKGKRRGYIEKTESDITVIGNLAELKIPEYMK
jgi:uncharacterized protein Yka (UPF0111/DUF47 family)